MPRVFTHADWQDLFEIEMELGRITREACSVAHAISFAALDFRALPESEGVGLAPACPDCGSTRTTLYLLAEDAWTLYCDECKREEPFAG